MQYLDDGDLSLVIDLDQGARISSLLFRDLEVTIPSRGSLVNWGWYSMAPWAGRIRDGLITDSAGAEHQLPIVLDPPHALHGFGVMYGWQELGKGRARLEFPEPYLGASVTQQIELVDNAIRWSLEYDDGGVDLPFWLGMHPWFARELGRGASAELEFDAEEMLVRGSDGLPTGEITRPGRGPYDDAFTKMRGVPRIVWDGALAVTIESDAPWWVIYTEDSDGICVEPQSAPPDAANLGISGEGYLEALFLFEEM